jgi:hypothetical protein
MQGPFKTVTECETAWILSILHGQNTAALQLINISGQAILQKLTRRDIFVKQADMNNPFA